MISHLHSKDALPCWSPGRQHPCVSCSALTYPSSCPIIEGNQADFPLGESMLTTPDHLLAFHMLRDGLQDESFHHFYGSELVNRDHSNMPEQKTLNSFSRGSWHPCQSELRCIFVTPNLVMCLMMQAEHSQREDETVGIPERERIKEPLPQLPDFLLLPSGTHPLFTEEALAGFTKFCRISENLVYSLCYPQTFIIVIIKALKSKIDTAIFPPREHMFHPSNVPLGKAIITYLWSVLTKSKKCQNLATTF